MLNRPAWQVPIRSRDTLQVNSDGRVVIDAEQISSMVGAKPENKHSILQAGEDALAAIKAALEDPELAEQAFSQEPTEYSWMEVTINSKTRRRGYAPTDPRRGLQGRRYPDL